MDQWYRTDSSAINPHTYGQLIFDKEGMNIQCRKDSFFSKWCQASWTATGESMKLEHTLATCAKNKLKMIGRLKYNTWYRIIPRREHRQNIL